MKTKKTPAPRRAGTLTADRALRLMGDDPATLVLAIALMDRILANRRSRRGRRAGAESY